MFHCTEQYAKTPAKIGAPGSTRKLATARTLATALKPATAGTQLSAGKKATALTQHHQGCQQQ
jgi:hypothetical protein